VAPEVLAIFTGITPKPRFYDSKQPLKPHKRERRKKGRERRRKKTPHIYNFYIGLLWRNFLSDKKPLAVH